MLETGGDLARQVPRQQRNVARALAQRRELDREDLQPVEKVGAKFTGAHHRGELAVSGRDDARVRGQRRSAADAFEAMIVEHPKQLGLDARRQLADLVQEERAAARQLEATRASPVGAGEGALLMSEKLRLDERLGDRRAVDGDERAAPAWRQRVQGAREELFAGAALSRQEHRALGRRDARKET